MTRRPRQWCPGQPSAGREPNHPSSSRRDGIRLDELVPSVRAVLMAFIGYLLVFWLVMLTVDIYDVAGLRTLLRRDIGYPSWFHMFFEGGPIVWAQAVAYYGVVAALCAAVGLVWGCGSRRDQWMIPFLLLMAVGTTLMVLEDTNNVGQRIGSWVAEVVGDDSIVVRLVRLPIFALAGTIPLFALWRYRRRLWQELSRAFGLMLGAWALFAVIAVTAELLTLVMPLYPRVGGFLLDVVFGGRPLDLPRKSGPAFFPGTADEDMTAVVFMDFVYEESLELIAAAFLLAGAVQALRTVLDRTRDGEEASSGRL